MAKRVRREQTTSYREERAYIAYDGNAVRRLAVPETVETPEVVEVPGRKSGEEVRRKRRAREKALHMSPLFVAFSAGVLMMVLALSVSFIGTQTRIQGQIREIQNLRSELDELKQQNSDTEVRIALASDINQIYRTATEELGMVKPDNSQVIYYEQTEREYVQQYENIPTE